MKEVGKGLTHICSCSISTHSSFPSLSFVLCKTDHTSYYYSGSRAATHLPKPPSHMPHLASSASSAAAFAVSGGGHPTPTPTVAFPRAPPRSSVRARGAVGREEARTAEPEQQPTFYDLLGISPEGSSFEDIRAAYRRMARKYHPDVSPPDAAKENTRRFIQLQEAYETLSDPSRRHSYDRALARGLCRLAFSTSSRRASSLYQDQEEKSGWRTSWEGQIAELKKRSTGKDSEENLSWGARMRRRRAESSSAEQL